MWEVTQGRKGSWESVHHSTNHHVVTGISLQRSCKHRRERRHLCPNSQQLRGASRYTSGLLSYCGSPALCSYNEERALGVWKMGRASRGMGEALTESATQSKSNHPLTRTPKLQCIHTHHAAMKMNAAKLHMSETPCSLEKKKGQSK